MINGLIALLEFGQFLVGCRHFKIYSTFSALV